MSKGVPLYESYALFFIDALVTKLTKPAKTPPSM